MAKPHVNVAYGIMGALVGVRCFLYQGVSAAALSIFGCTQGRLKFQISSRITRE